MSKQRIEIEVDIPEGWEWTGEYRPCRAGDFFVDPGNPTDYARTAVRESGTYLHLILRRKEPDAVKLARDCLRAHAEWRSCNCLWCKLAHRVIADFENGGAK